MSCKLWGKVTSVSFNINFGAKTSILCQKNENLGEMLTFHAVCTTTEIDYLFAKCDFLCEGLYTITNRQILIKTISVS